MNTLVIDIGGTNVKVIATGIEKRIKIPSGSEMSPERMVKEVLAATSEWSYERISIGYPGPVVDGQLIKEPHNLASGWVGFDFEKAFGYPVKIINDAAMQAFGSYKGGRMLFLGIGTGLGSALIINGEIQPTELAHLPYKNDKTFEEYLGVQALEKNGKKDWRKDVTKVVDMLRFATQTDYVILGGGNAKHMKELPENTFLGSNSSAFEGGFRLWSEA